MNNRESPLPSFPQTNQGPAFLPPSHLMRKREELAYQFSDADESSDSHQASAQGTTSVGALVAEPQNIHNTANNNLLTIPRENYHHHDQLFTLGKLDTDSQRSNSGVTPTHLQAATASVQNFEISSPSNTLPNGGQVQEKKLQTQLEASQSRLFNLAKKIDACLSVSKTNYTESKVLQPAADTSRTVSSLNDDLKDQRSLPESARGEKLSNQLGAPEIVIKPETPSLTSCEGTNQKHGNLARLNTIESQLMKTDPDQPPLKSSRTKTELVISSMNSWKPLLENGSKSLLPNFKQFETTSSLNLETTNDIPKAKDSYLFAKMEASYGNTPSPIPKLKEEEFTLQKTASKDTFKLDTSKDEIQRVSHRQSREVPAQVIKSPTAENRFSFSNPITHTVKSSAKKGGSQTENKEPAAVPKNNTSNTNNKPAPKLNNLTSPRAVSNTTKTSVKSPNNFTSPKAHSANKTAAPQKQPINKKPASVSASKNTAQKAPGIQANRAHQRSQYEFEGEPQHIELENDIPEFMSQEDLSPPVPQKLKTKNAELPHISNPSSPQNAISKTKPQKFIAPFKAKKMSFPVPKHKSNLELLNTYASDAPFELTQTISPVLNDRKSSRGLTSAYHFDAPNLSINDTKNMSFESSSVFLAKESSVKTTPPEKPVVVNTKEIKKPVRKSETFRSSKAIPSTNLQKIPSVSSNKAQVTKSRSRGLSNGKNEREYYDDELEGSFVKAYTAQKNKVIKDVDTFEDRMDSDVYFRRKFKNDLQQFLDQYKPTLTEEEAQDLYDRLVVDSKRREVKAHRLEIQKEKSNKTKPDSLKSLPEEQISQTFDRLAGDARRRMFAQEEKEKMKIIKLQEEFEKFEQEKNSKKLKPEDEEMFISKMMHDANRRKIKLEKEQRMKFETEEREIQELASQRFVSSGNRAKSKVREYIETQPDLRPETAKNSKSVPRTKSAKSIRSITARKSSDTIPNMIENPDFFDKRFASPKNRFLSIASPPNKIKNSVKESPQTGKKSSPPKEDLSSLEYLQSLRKDIDQYRSNIEDNINTIQSYDSGPTSAPRNHPLTHRSPPEKSQEKKLLIHGLVSPRNNERPSNKVSNKYKNVESKVAKHIENIGSQQTDSSIAHELKSHRATPQNKGLIGSVSAIKSGSSSKKSLNNLAGTRVSSKAKLAEVDEKERKSNSTTSSSKMHSKFMNAQNAINFVEKLISDFKVGNKV